MVARPAAVVTSLDVIDNFVASRRGNRDLVEFSGQDLWELGQQVQTFAAAYVPPATEVASHPVYIGGWPSANFWAAMHSPLILSTLLYSGQVLVKDPLIDWFSLDRYRSDQVLPSRQGYLTDCGQPAIDHTRAFLSAVWPSLQRLRPLVEAGALVLVPSERFVAANPQVIAALVARLETEPRLEPRMVTDKFRPAELAWSDTARGMFAFAGGEADIQIQRAVRRSLEHFAREYLLAQHYGANYSAPWNYEQYICEQGLEKSLCTSESQRVVQALWASSLPIFHGLTPALLAQVRQDDSFVGFRAALYDAYRGLSAGVAEDEYARYVAEAEGALLQPHISAAEYSARSGLLSRVGVQLAGFVVQLGGAYVVDLAKGEVGGPTLLQGAVAQIISQVTSRALDTSGRAVWTRLARHQRTVETELANVSVKPAQIRPAAPAEDNAPLDESPAVDQDDHSEQPWYIPDEPSMSIRVTTGAMLIDKPEMSLTAPEQSGDYVEGDYRSCECGSGLKYRFCCKRLPAVAPEWPYR